METQLSWRDSDLKEGYMRQMWQISGRKWGGHIRKTEDELYIEKARCLKNVFKEYERKHDR